MAVTAGARRRARRRPASPSVSVRGLAETAGQGRSVLVTGASGGIGRAIVGHLADHGFDVWAAVHSDAGRAAFDDALGDRVRTVVFDVTDGDAIAGAAEEIGRSGPLFGLVNNAGAALPGPLEYVPIEQFRQQIEINLTGQLRVTQAMLPALRRGTDSWPDARIVMMGSLDGRIVGPLFGPYAASKHALVGLADALRSELRPSRIKVVLLEPGVIATPIWQRGISVLDELQPQLPDGGGPYRGVIDFARGHVGNLSRWGASPDRVADAVLRSLVDQNPRPRRVVGVDAAVVAAALQLLPPRAIYRVTALPAIWSNRQWARQRGSR